MASRSVKEEEKREMYSVRGMFFGMALLSLPPPFPPSLPPSLPPYSPDGQNRVLSSPAGRPLPIQQHDALPQGGNNGGKIVIGAVRGLDGDAGRLPVLRREGGREGGK